MGMHTALHTTSSFIIYLETGSDTPKYTTLVWQLLQTENLENSKYRERDSLWVQVDKQLSEIFHPPREPISKNKLTPITGEIGRRHHD